MSMSKQDNAIHMYRHLASTKHIQRHRWHYKLQTEYAADHIHTLLAEYNLLITKAIIFGQRSR